MRRLGWTSWTELPADPQGLIVLPLGSCEQHGPHLPLCTDTVVATALAEGLAAQRDDVALAPALAYGSSGEHAGFPGTLSIGTDALTSVLVELGRSSVRFASGIVFVNGHGGNLEAIEHASAILAGDGVAVLAWAPAVPGGDAHAGRTETSLLLALAPDQVALERAEAGERRPLTEVWDTLRATGVAAVAPNGVLGDPAGASAEEGRAILDTLTGDLVAAVAVRFGPASTV